MTLVLKPTWTYGGAAPKFATQRNPDHATDGKRIAVIAKAMGKPGMPWQRYVWDVANERDAFGRYVYEIILITVPRQSGKTTAVGPVQIDRVLLNDRIKCFYTAQTGKDARSRFNDLVQLVQGSPLHDAPARYRFSAGDEAISFPNGSALKIFAPVAAALHGETPPLVTLDEIWEFDETLGDAILEGAIIPAQMTLAGRRQIWMISTAGTAASTFMKKWVERGRSGKHPKMAFFEWSLADGDDPYDVEAIARFHPAVGFTVTAEELLEISKTVSRAEWLRAFCNVWTEALDPVMSAEDWADLAQPMDVPSVHDIAITYDVAPENETGRVMAVWRDAEGRPCGRVLHAAPGTAWMLSALVRLWREWQPAVMGADDGGPTRWLTDALRRTIGEEHVITTGGKDFGTACEALLTYAREDRSLRHDGSAVLAREMAALVLTRTGDTTRFSRTQSPAPVAGLIAFAVGIWLYDHQDAGYGAPEIYFPTGATR